MLSSTDAAAVFSVLRGVGVSKRLRGALELESGMNDAPVVLAVVVLASDDPITWLTPVLVVYELVAGAVIGYALGRAGAWALRRAALPSTGLYPLAAIASACSRTRPAQLAHASGLLATYVAALVLGNSNLPHRGDVLSFAEGTGWLAQIGLFVLLGLYASPTRLVDAVVPALIAGVVLVVAARPLSVIVAAAPFRVPWREQAFLSWSGLRGAVPIVLALVALQEGATNGAAAGRRRVRARRRPHSPAGHDAAVRGAPARRGGGRAAGDRGRRRPAGRAGRGPAAGPRAGGLPAARGLPARARLPRGATVSLVVRDEEAFTPTVDTRLRVGDQILVVTTAAAREATERRIRAVDRAGRLARWHGESGSVDSGEG